MDRPCVWLITGIQASGKTTIADLLAPDLPPAVHIRGGQFRRWAVSGWEQPTDSGASPRARRLLDLRYGLSARVASEYIGAGFNTVVQDNIYGDDVVTWLKAVPTPRRLVVLRPSLEAVIARNHERQRTTGKVAYRPGEFTPQGLDRLVETTPRVGLWLDTSSWSPQKTVREILSRSAESNSQDLWIGVSCDLLIAS